MGQRRAIWDVNHYQRGMGHGATITDRREVLEHYLRIASDRTLTENERVFARGVIMGAARRLNKQATHFALAIETLGLRTRKEPA